MSAETLLIELGTEELPPKSLKKLSDAFSLEILNGLLDAELITERQAGDATPYATPRRLAIQIPEVIGAQPNQTVERRGPAIQAAFNADGDATPAALGFAKSCGVSVNELGKLKTDKGEWLAYTVEEPGKTITDLVPAIIEQAIKRLPIAKRMRWGASDAEFVRPVHWLIVMHADRVIQTTLLGLQSANLTRGHRFYSSGDLMITHADDYQNVLLEQGHVVANFAERQNRIASQIEDLAEQLNGVIETDQALLDEVTGLVEFPNAVLGRFDQKFLDVPKECLVSSMRDHQKYFHINDKQGQLLPNFITVSNIQSKDPARVRDGNQRVLHARLSDAQFFWLTDQKVTLESRVKKLDSVLFHIKLGSIGDKTKRLQQLAASLTEQIGGNSDLAARAALLSKADLVSDMVGEFDDLQGTMGQYYAQIDGEDTLVGNCIEQHYWPKFAGDQLPESAEAQALAMADKLDNLVGIFAAGEVPTGDKDPYALRRAALSILRILIERQRPLNLTELVTESAGVYGKLQDIAVDIDTQKNIVDFLRGRLTAYYQSQKIPTTTIRAVMACEPDSPLDFENRIKAVHQFARLPEASDLAAANKRIANILKKNSVNDGVEPDANQLIEPSEKSLYQAIQNIEQDCTELFDTGNYAQGLQKLAALRTPVDDFFEHVMVMSDDPALQQNRLSLLNKMQQLFLRVADISLMQAHDQPTEK